MASLLMAGDIQPNPGPYTNGAAGEQSTTALDIRPALALDAEVPGGGADRSACSGGRQLTQGKQGGGWMVDSPLPVSGSDRGWSQLHLSSTSRQPASVFSTKAGGWDRSRFHGGVDHEHHGNGSFNGSL